MEAIYGARDIVRNPSLLWIDSQDSFIVEDKKAHKRLGIYWSWDRTAAEAHWGKFDKGYRTVKLISKIKEKHVDWHDTFELNINPSIGEAEREIRLFKNTPIKLNAIIVDRKPIDISKIKDKVFRA